MFFLREPIHFLHFKKNHNVPESQIPHAKMSPEIRGNTHTNSGDLHVEVSGGGRKVSVLKKKKKNPYEFRALRRPVLHGPGLLRITSHTPGGFASRSRRVWITFSFAAKLHFDERRMGMFISRSFWGTERRQPRRLKESHAHTCTRMSVVTQGPLRRLPAPGTGQASPRPH